MLVEALHEVVNVLSALFNTRVHRTRSCTSCTHRARTSPGDIEGMLAAFNRIDLDVDVQGYGKGSLSPGHRYIAPRTPAALRPPLPSRVARSRETPGVHGRP